MKVLTIWQPWASLIMAGAKPYEFRKWDYRTRARNLVGQRVVIHAGARKVRKDEVADLLEDVRRGDNEGTALIIDLARPLLERVHLSPGCLPLAAGLGTAILGEPKRAVDLFGGDHVADSTRIDQHVWAWPLTDIQPFEPVVPCRGFQGFWRWPYEIKGDGTVPAAQETAARSTDHRCPKAGCTADVPHHMLACRTHWFELPKPLRDAIKQTYRRDPEAHRRNIGEAIRMLAGAA